MSEPNTERLVAEQLIGRPRGIDVERVYEMLPDIFPERIDRAIEHLREAGVLHPSNHGRIVASEPVLYLEDLGLLGSI